jgi:hypothetical protein
VRIEKSPDEEAAIAVDFLEKWATTNKVTIDHFIVTPQPSWADRWLTVRGRTSGGQWVHNAILLDNLNAAQDVDDAMIALASAKGWAQMQAGRKFS